MFSGCHLHGKRVSTGTISGLFKSTKKPFLVAQFSVGERLVERRAPLTALFAAAPGGQSPVRSFRTPCFLLLFWLLAPCPVEWPDGSISPWVDDPVM